MAARRRPESRRGPRGSDGVGLDRPRSGPDGPLGRPARFINLIYRRREMTHDALSHAAGRIHRARAHTDTHPSYAGRGYNDSTGVSE